MGGEEEEVNGGEAKGVAKGGGGAGGEEEEVNGGEAKGAAERGMVEGGGGCRHKRSHSRR